MDETDPLLGQNELVSLLPGFIVIDQQHRPVGDHGVVEYAGIRPAFVSH
jgi:hypothetical protein